ncbi:Co-chaperone Hsc20 [Xylaria cf. heliscus]|nr:Co-chaperone Hsc20 [Xylaria cf. heliscus]
MRSSILPPRLASRVCAFCKPQQQQQQQQQCIATTRNLHISSTTQRHRAQGLPCVSRSQNRVSSGSTTRAPTSVTRRSFTSSSRARSNQSETKPETETDADADADADAAKAKAKAPQTHYDFFPKTLPDGPPPRGPFAIDVRALRREFLGLQAGAHPDLHPSHLKARAQATSARINEAFRTLENPLRRAQHVLALRGFDVAEDETARVEDPELLMLVLEARERVEEAVEEEELGPLREENEGRIREAEDRLGRLFAEDRLEEAREEVVRLRYWVNVRESIDNWERGKPVVLEH